MPKKQIKAGRKEETYLFNSAVLLNVDRFFSNSVKQVEKKMNFLPRPLPFLQTSAAEGDDDDDGVLLSDRIQYSVPIRHYFFFIISIFSLLTVFFVFGFFSHPMFGGGSFRCFLVIVAAVVAVAAAADSISKSKEVHPRSDIEKVLFFGVIEKNREKKIAVDSIHSFNGWSDSSF